MTRRVLSFAFVACAMLAAGFAHPASAAAREPVRIEDGGYRAGTILISNRQRKLYLLLGSGEAYRYPVAVGKPGKQWLGGARIKGKYVEPSWSPPAEVKRDKPFLPNLIAGGSPKNPMGPRALLLDRDQYAIHGTNRPSSIGTYASYGCIRMRNEDIVDLFERVSVGAQVVVVP